MMDKDTSRGSRADFVQAESEALNRRLTELRPFLAEAARIERRLQTLLALASVESTTPRTPSASARKRFSMEARSLQVLNLLAVRPGLTRKAVGEALGLQPARAGKIVNRCIADDLVREEDGLALTDKAFEALQPEMSVRVAGSWQSYEVSS